MVDDAGYGDAGSVVQAELLRSVPLPGAAGLIRGAAARQWRGRPKLVYATGEGGMVVYDRAELVRVRSGQWHGRRLVTPAGVPTGG